MRRLLAEYMQYDDETGRAEMVCNPEYDYDDVPTRQPSDAEVNAAINAVVYERQIEAMIYEAEPMIAVYANIAAMLLGNTGKLLPHVANAESAAGRSLLESALYFGKQADELYNSQRAKIERAMNEGE